MTWKVRSDEGTAAARDLAPQRRQRIRSIVESRRAARLEDLSTSLGVSQATVRRDLDALAMEGRLRRVHGRRRRPRRAAERAPFRRQGRGGCCGEGPDRRPRVELLSPDDTVYLDSGSTVLEAARLLRGWDRLTVRHEQPARRDGAGRPRPAPDRHRGEFRATSQALVGPLTHLVLDALHVDRALIGTFRVLARGGAHDHGPCGGVHEGAGPRSFARGDPACRQPEGRHALVRQLRPPRGDRCPRHGHGNRRARRAQPRASGRQGDQGMSGGSTRQGGRAARNRRTP